MLFEMGEIGDVAWIRFVLFYKNLINKNIDNDLFDLF
jgi:hypothetical protein